MSQLLGESQSQEVARNFFSREDTGELIGGKLAFGGDFYGFHHARIEEQIAILETQWKEYEMHSLGEVASEINEAKRDEHFKEKENAIYIPKKIGAAPVVYKVEETSVSEFEYFQVVLGEDAIAEYVCAFFRSDLGKLVIQSLMLDQDIPRIVKDDIRRATIALPSVKTQQQILSTQRKMRNLKDAIDEFDAELALNPLGSVSISGHVDNMLEAIGKLSEADEMLSIVRQGESTTVEFKETLSLDVKDGSEKKKYLETSVFKTIVGFLNSEGGTLLVGVEDGGAITGLNKEVRRFYKGSRDAFRLHFKNLLSKYVGPEYYPLVSYKEIDFKGDFVLLVRCEEASEPCFMDGKEFFVRTNPATDKLEGKKQADYIKNRFHRRR